MTRSPASSISAATPSVAVSETRIVQRGLGAGTIVFHVGTPIKRLSPDELEERRRLGLCFNCDEPYGRGHNRTCKHLFLLDLAEADDTDSPETADKQATEAADPVISLHTIAGVHTRETMRVPVSLAGAACTALLDSGSTHNFISEIAAACTGSSLHHEPACK